MVDEITKLKTDIEAIKTRNRRVEADKAWETSLVRIISISVVTYLVVVIFMFITKTEQPFVSALIPALAYLIANISLGLLKNWWLSNKK